MSDLEFWLDEFKQAMLAKFKLRKTRNPKSVTDADFDWYKDLDLQEVEAHLKKEIDEWLAPDADKHAEDVDLANMAFLDWVARSTKCRECNYQCCDDPRECDPCAPGINACCRHEEPL